MAKNRPDGDRRKEAFGAALAEAMRAREVAPRALAEHMGVSDDAVRKWQGGRSEPHPTTVLAIESYLSLSPGDLSRHLGYVPVDDATSVPAAIDADPRLTVEAKEMLRAAYRAAVKASRGDTRDQVERHA